MHYGSLACTSPKAACRATQSSCRGTSGKRPDGPVYSDCALTTARYAACTNTATAQNIHIDKSAGLRAILATIIGGRVANDKHLTAEVWNWSNTALEQIAAGYLGGDGHIDGDRIRLGFTRNYALERDIRTLAARLGATLTLKLSIATNQDRAFPAFRGEWRWQGSIRQNARQRSEITALGKSKARKFWDIALADDPHTIALASGVLTHNSNPMPESVSDRPTSAYEMVFLLTKQGRYFYDGEALRTPWSESSVQRLNQPTFETQTGGPKDPKDGNRSHRKVLENLKRRQPAGWATSPSYNDQDPRYAARYPGEEPVAQHKGSNSRNVWQIPTQGRPEAHFATFPDELPRRCILAGTSEHGVCADCGAPWERTTTREVVPKPGNSGRSSEERKAHRHELRAFDYSADVITQTVGWQPTCDHNAARVPATVLDPFIGSGTTVAVAQQLGRHGIGLDLNPDYLSIARRRLEGITLPMAI